MSVSKLTLLLLIISLLTPMLPSDERDVQGDRAGEASTPERKDA